MENGVITTKIYKACAIELCDRKLKADMLVLDTRGYDVILGMTYLSKYHAVIDCCGKKVNFRILYQPEFQFIGEFKSTSKRNQLNRTIGEDKEKRVPIWNKFPDVFKEISGLCNLSKNHQGQSL